MKRLQKLLAGCLTAAIVSSMAVPPAGALSIAASPAPNVRAAASAFTDTNSHWAKDKIDRWANRGLISGISATLFAPDAQLSRAQLFAIMNRLQRNTAKADLSAFTDVKPDAWYYDDIAKAVAAGFATGSNGRMRPDDPVTRQEVAVVFVKALGINTSSAPSLSQFSDSGQIADWARAAVGAAVQHGFLRGYSNGGFGGSNAMTRAEIISMIDSAFSGYYDAAGSFSGDVNGNVYVNADGVSLSGAISGTLFLSPNLTDGVILNGAKVSRTSTAAELSGTQGAQPQTTPPDNTEKKPSSITNTAVSQKRRPSSGSSGSGSGSGGSNTPVIPSPEPADPTISPDRDAIIRQMTNITDGFEIRDIPYETRDHHPDHFETRSHPFSSMYCSVGNIPELVRKYYAVDPSVDDPYAVSAAATDGKKAGTYYEKEFFMSGIANVYALSADAPESANVPVIQSTGADYTTRLLMHYPTEASEFSGRIYVDILNASSGVDLEDVFRRSYENMIRDGDIYIGITSKASSAQALKNFNPERYADMDWCVDNANLDKEWTTNSSGGTSEAVENGLFWDMLSQLGTVIKSQPELLFGNTELAAKVKNEGRSYLMGQSQSHMFLNTYLDVFYPYVNNILGGKDIWNGYIGLVGGKATTELSTGVTIAANPDFTVTDEPYIAIMSGFETMMRLMGSSAGSWYYQAPTAPMNRLYEVTSAPHACPTAAILPNNYEIAAARPNGTSRDLKSYTGDHVEGDVHLNQFVTAVLENIDLWVTHGTPAPASITMSSELDQWGNRTGGLRSPKIEAPVAKYYDAVIGDDLSKIGTEGSMVWFTDAELKAAYPGGYDEYAAKFKAAADKLLADRYIVQEDYDAWMQECAANKAKIFGAADTAQRSLTRKVTLKDVTPADMETMFNSTAMSISAKYAEAWDAVAPEWAKSFQLVEDRGDNFIQLQNSMVLDGTDPILYEEKEIFVDGEASLYALAPENDIRIKESGLPYTNRIIVRTPADPKDFTGKVWIDNLNATDKFDSEALWRRAGAMIMNNGDAYIGISSKPLTIKTLQIFGEQVGRSDYADLSWESPNTYIFSNFTRDAANRPNGNLEDHISGVYRDTEIINTDIGFLWDILAQTGYAAKDPANWKTLFNVTDPSGVKINTYLFGQSQSGFNATTYGLFHQLLEEQGADLPYDGIMTMVGTLFPARSLNQSDKNIPKTEGYTIDMGGYFGSVNYYIPSLKTPFFFAAGENDMNPALFRKVIESGSFPNVRYFEMAGVPHSDNNTPSFPTNDILGKAVTGGKSGAESSMNYLHFDADTETYSVVSGGSDINANMFVRGLLTALDKAANGGAMPDNQLIETLTTAEQNAVGGLQSPQVSVPLNIYQKNGKMTALENVSYTADAYKTEFAAALEQLRKDGWILDIDVQYMTAYADRIAKNLDNDSSILSSVKRVPEVVEQPYDDGVGYHDSVIDKSHAFNSMYCSNGRNTKDDTNPEPVRFDTDYGYEEHEFFLSGTAQTYNYDKTAKKLTVAVPNIDYTTRALVRYPKNKADFNGTVVVDLMNITAGYENEDLWRRSYDYLMRAGYGYVGLSYHPTGIESLKLFDADRYADLKWYDGKYPSAMAFDVISQLGSLLRTEEGENMLGGNSIDRVILTAQSSSAYYLNGYLHGFDSYLATANEGEPLFDGYINIVGSALGIAIDNPDNYGNAFMNQFPTTIAPMVAVMSEYEASASFPFGYPRVDDKDNFWVYEVAGTPHSDPMSPILPNFDEQTKANTKGTPITDKEYAPGEYESELQLDQIVSGALDNLVKLLKKEIRTMPSAADRRIDVGKTDKYGNTIGGIRMPQIEAPLAKFMPSASNPDGSKGQGTNGSMSYLSWEQLNERYGSSAENATVDSLFTQYRKDFAAAANQLCKDGFIRQAECDSLIAWSENQRSVFEKAAEDAGISESETSPAETETSLEESAASPDESAASPDESTASPEESAASPDESATSPDESTASPDESAASPDESATSPDESTASPEESAASPDESAASPEESAPSPDESVTSPEETAPSPEESATSPEESAASPDESAASPDESAASPDESATSPEETAPSPDESAAPDTSAQTQTVSEPSADAPAAPAEAGS